MNDLTFDCCKLEKCADGLLPVIIQDAVSLKVLMMGYMNREAFDKTLATGKVTFFSRTRQQLWTKGETSGNFLNVEEMYLDCDGDTLLIKAQSCRADMPSRHGILFRHSPGRGIRKKTIGTDTASS